MWIVGRIEDKARLGCASTVPAVKEQGASCQSASDPRPRAVTKILKMNWQGVAPLNHRFGRIEGLMKRGEDCWVHQHRAGRFRVG